MQLRMSILTRLHVSVPHSLLLNSLTALGHSRGYAIANQYS